MFSKECRKRAKEKGTCKYCSRLFCLGGLGTHHKGCIENPINKNRRRKICPVCKNEFFTENETCSYACANKKFRTGKNHWNWLNATYSTICFSIHGKKCIVCGETKIVGTHHINENHEDNRPENLVPLCPTHHQYCHSRYKNIVQPHIERFVKEYKQGVGQKLTTPFGTETMQVRVLSP